MLIKYDPTLTNMQNIEAMVVAAGYPRKYLADLSYVFGDVDAGNGAAKVTISVPDANHPIALANDSVSKEHDYTRVHVADYYVEKLNAPRTPTNYYLHYDSYTPPLKLETQVGVDYPGKPLSAELNKVHKELQDALNQYYNLKYTATADTNCLYGEKDFNLYIFSNVSETMRGGYFIYTPYHYQMGANQWSYPFSAVNHLFSYFKHGTGFQKTLFWRGNVRNHPNFFGLEYPTEADVLVGGNITTLLSYQYCKRIDKNIRNGWGSEQTFQAPIVIDNTFFDTAQNNWITENGKQPFSRMVPVTYNFGPSHTYVKEKVFKESEVTFRPNDLMRSVVSVFYLVSDFNFAWRYYQYENLPKPNIDIMLNTGMASALPEPIRRHAWKNLEAEFTPTGAKYSSEYSRLHINVPAEVKEFTLAIVKEITRGQHFTPTISLQSAEHNWNNHVLVYKVTPTNTENVFNKQAYDPYMEGEIIIEFDIANYEAINLPERLYGFTNNEPEAPVVNDIIDMTGFVEI